MFGKIIRVVDNYIYVENRMEKSETNLIGYHLVFSDTSKQLVGEIINISIKEIEVLLIGEIKDNKFIAGIIKKPSSNCSIRVINKKEVEVTKIRNLGKKSLKEVIDKVKEMGLSFKD